jgi:hypothetical protein
MNHETQDIETRLLFPKEVFFGKSREQVLRRPAGVRLTTPAG